MLNNVRVHNSTNENVFKASGSGGQTTACQVFSFDLQSVSKNAPQTEKFRQNRNYSGSDKNNSGRIKYPNLEQSRSLGEYN